MLKVVVDTNVIVSALLKPYSNPALILSLITQKQLNLCLSAVIFNEYKEVLGYSKFKQLDQEKVKKLLAQLKKDAIMVAPMVSINIIKDHPVDNIFLECAFTAKADFLITGNTKHFSLKTFHHINILTPSEFLSDVIKTLPEQG